MRETLGRWLYRIVSCALILIAVYVISSIGAVLYERHGPDIRLDERLPALFHRGGNSWIYAGWVIGLGIGAAIGVSTLLRVLRRARAVDHAATGSADPLASTEGPIYLMLGPSVSAIDRLFAAAGLTLRGDFIANGEPAPCVYLKANADSATTLARAMTARDRGLPRLRGLFVVVPLDELIEAPPARWATTVRGDLESIRNATDLDLPVYLIVTGLERDQGFLELAATRGPQAEWGITLPREPLDDEPERSLTDFSERIRRRTLRALRKGFPDRQLNCRLFGTVAQFQGLRPALLTACDAAFPRDVEEPIYLRGVFLAATGATPEEWAYARSPLRLQVIRDLGQATWSARAILADLEERCRAWRLAALGALAAAAVWAYILLGLGSLGVVGWWIAGVLAAIWMLALSAMAWRWPAAA